MSHTLISCTCKNRLGFSFLPFTLIPQYLKEIQLIKNTLKQTKFEDKTVKSTQLSCSRWPPWFPDLSRLYGAFVKRGNGKHMFDFSLFRPSCSQISPHRANNDSNIPSPWRTRLVKCPTPGPTKTIKSPPHALPPDSGWWPFHPLDFWAVKVDEEQSIVTFLVPPPSFFHVSKLES